MKVKRPTRKPEQELRDLNFIQELFYKYHGRLVLFANKFTGDIQVSQDLVQDAFLKLWEKAEIRSTIESPKAYLFKAVRNNCLNHHRHISIKQSVEEQLSSKIDAQEQLVYSGLEDPMYSLLEMEMEEKVQNIIKSLPERCREVYKLSRYSFLKNKEIADKLGISVKMVEKHISKALTILRVELSEYLGLILLVLFKEL